MGARSYIVRGKGNPESFHSLQPRRGPRDVAHRGDAGASRSRTTPRRPQGVECRKDADVIDETPAAYKSIDDGDGSAGDLVEVVHTLRQVVCVKG